MKQLIITVLITLIIIVSTHPMIYADNNLEGLLENKEASFDGYTLFASGGSLNVYLIDRNGQIVHEWQIPRPAAFEGYIDGDGNLIQSVITDFYKVLPGFVKMSWEGELLWEFGYPFVHHGFEPLPNGNVLLITEEIIPGTEALSLGRDPSLLSGYEGLSFLEQYLFTPDNIPVGDFLWMPRIIEIAQTGPASGTIVWEWRARDHLIQDHDESKANYGEVAEHPELINLNYASQGASPHWVHANAVDYNPELDQVMLTSRNFSEIWIIDHSTTIEEAGRHTGGQYEMGGDILYRWGNPQAYDTGASEDQRFFGPHNGQWIGPDRPGSGNLLIFNNGSDRSEHYSSVIEIVPPYDDHGGYKVPEPGIPFEPRNPYWRWVSQPPEDFYSPAQSGAQRLPNGNTIILDSSDAQLIEVNPENKIVWKYNIPSPEFLPIVEIMLGDNNAVFDCRTYRPDYPGFDDIELIPQGTVEECKVMSELILEASSGGVAVLPYGGSPVYCDGQVVTIDAEPDPGYDFDSWLIQSGSVTIRYPDRAWTTLIMGDRASTVKAYFIRVVHGEESDGWFPNGWLIAIFVILGIIVLGSFTWMRWKK